MNVESKQIEGVGMQLPPELLRLVNDGNDIRVGRDLHLAEKVLIVAGLPGCGKTMLAPIVGALPRVELMQYSFLIEYVCALRYLGKIEEDAAAFVVQIQTDLQLYNMMMSREINFRPSDLSSVFRNSRPIRHFRRLFQRGDAAAVDRINAEKPILNLTMHDIPAFSAPIFAALGSRVLFVQVVRHPLYMIRQQSLYSNRHGKDVRDFNVWYQHKGETVPWFTLGWEDTFLKGNAVERSIYTMYYQTKRMEHLFSTVDGYEDSIMVVPFEQFVIDPWPFMTRLETELDIKMDSRTKKAMKTQNVPRKMFAQGISVDIYKQYGWRPPAKGADERSELDERRQFAADTASFEAMEILDQLCAEYEAKYLPS